MARLRAFLRRLNGNPSPKPALPTFRSENLWTPAWRGWRR